MRNPIHIFIKFTVAAVILWILYLVAIDLLFPATKDGVPWAERGQFGDMFGAMTCLFSAMTLAGLIATIIHQNEQTQAQYETQKRTDEALARQAEADLSQHDGGTIITLRDGRKGTCDELIYSLKTKRHNLNMRLDDLLKKAVEMLPNRS